MSQPETRTPYEHSLYMINTTDDSINKICRLPDGRPRDLPGDVTSGVLAARSNLAIASALLAIADALKGRQA